LNILFVVSNPKDWPLEIPGVTLLSARTYLTDPKYFDYRPAKVFNLSRSYKYQSAGYYVSLLASARGHHPLPSLATIQDLRSLGVARLLSEDLDATLVKAFKNVVDDQVELPIYFGRNPTTEFDRLAWQLFGLFEAPLLKADFVRRGGEWQLKNIRTLDASDIPSSEHPFLLEAAADYFSGKRRRVRPRSQSRYDLAILHDPAEQQAPSDPKALERFEDAAESLGFSVELITKDDMGRLAEFDGLFIRETTAVNHHTYRMARRAEAEGLVVIDDSDSILKCTNKVYLAELLTRHKISCPKTLIVHGDNIEDIVPGLGLPVVLKQPDSSFSKGVTKVETADELRASVKDMLKESELIVAQEFLPTEFDWRIGIIDGRPLYVCKYFMARRHWQIISRDDSGENAVEGGCQTLVIGEAPKEVVQTALKAANLIGSGLYGVDLKQIGNQCYVIEINDNPSIEAGYEDRVLKGALYREIMSVFLQRIEATKRITP
jgi:glutathione synthase/RimK-type ligase-like ATP-grasp enzyme